MSLWNKQLFLRVSLFFGLAHLLLVCIMFLPYFSNYFLDHYIVTAILYFLALYLFPFFSFKPYLKLYKNTLFSILLTAGQLMAMVMYIKFMGRHFTILLMPPILYYAIVYLLTFKLDSNEN